MATSDTPPTAAGTPNTGAGALVSPSVGTPTANHLNALLGSLSERTVACATGSSLPSGARLADDPQQRLWLGMLASEAQLIADAQRGHTLSGKLVPAAQGFSFRLPPSPSTDVTFTVSAAVFTALHPNVLEQRASVSGDQEGGADAGTESGTGAAMVGSSSGSSFAAQGAGATASREGRRLASIWSKAYLEPVTVTLTIAPDTPRRLRIGEDELASALDAAGRPAPGSEWFRPRRATNPPAKLPRDDDMLDQVTWDAYCATELVSAADVHPPVRTAAIDVEVMHRDDCTEVFATVVNTTPTIANQLFDGTSAYDQNAIDLRLYEANLTAAVAAACMPYELDQVAKSYRYDRTVDAFGISCPVRATRHDTHTTLTTRFAAEQETKRVHPRQVLHLPGQDRVPLDTSFTAFIADPVAALTALLDAHRAWVDHHWSSAELDRLGAEHGWDASARNEADADSQHARNEVNWVAAGIDLIRDDPKVRDAFVLANKTMAAVAANSSAPYDSWRPFQVAWIVGCLPGMVDPGTHTDVEIVWFATGGGKSEAYLGLMATTMFYGRLTGVTAGAQVWARFPLRLLALQQAERFAAVVCRAELLRRDDARLNHGDPFGLGYFVGGTNTPNRLYGSDSPWGRDVDPAAPETGERCRVLATCPVCEHPLAMHFDEPTWTMQHVCTNGACDIAGVLPVWGIDDDIYRHAPSVLVGTVDKLAQIGQAAHFRVLLGKPVSRCPVHGYSASPLWCAVFGCRLSGPVPDGFGHVRLEIADELHLLEESLGALDGMYETLLQAVSEALGNAPMQVVGATATIEGYQNQVRHLYRRPARRFPVNGPTVSDTFWSATDGSDPLRSYLGLRPRGITMVTATREVALAHASWLADLRDRPNDVLTAAGLDPQDPDAIASAAAAWADLYEVLVAYCLRNEDLSSLTRDSFIQGLLVSTTNLATINGDAEPTHIRDAVRRLVDPPTDPDERVKLIAATRAIGHGFDVSRLGVMVVMGTPTQAAEIIQASARVGRRWPGLVVNVINPTRDRDASVYRYYADWIRFLDRLVHKVPVNRESLPVLRRVLSGGMMAWLTQVHDVAWLTGAPRRKSLTSSVGFAAAARAGYIDKTTLTENLREGFGISANSVYHQMHRDAISAWVDQQLATLPLRTDGDRKLRDLLNPTVPTSLRDVEEPITIYGNV